MVRARLFHLPELDAQLVRMINANRSSLPADLAIHLIRTCLVSDPVVTSADLFNTLDTLAKIARHSSNGSSVLMLVEQARQVTRSGRHAASDCVKQCHTVLAPSMWPGGLTVDECMVHTAALPKRVTWN